MGDPRRPPPEPATPAQAALRAWLNGPPRRSQALLAAACRVSQQLISAYANGHLRPEAGSEAARLLEIATAGRVAASGWLTPEELAQRDAHNMRAAAFACAITEGPRVAAATLDLVGRSTTRGRRPA